ncbi:hypothetical protein QTP70_000313 [Hemibagrus guttatus]|uniref:TRAF-type domain-containing protein n=1 Tax=Hemibagrus guttatus TaxID=175788 RepID=A0AAE0UXV2_9TELE|nr:hypothetical protein QTP70_000313 [Hemibagrus guttatus]
MSGGYEVELFVDPPDHDLICIICKGVLRCPCRNEQQGCTATFPLSEQYLHTSTCQFEWLLCPQQGCGTRILRKDAQAHAQVCSYWRQLCPMGCGTLLNRTNQAKHNCYRELQERYEAQRQMQRNIASTLRRKMQRMQSRMAQMTRQISLICESLELSENLEEEEEEESPGEGTSTGRSFSVGQSPITHNSSSSSSS